MYINIIITSANKVALSTKGNKIDQQESRGSTNKQNDGQVRRKQQVESFNSDLKESAKNETPIKAQKTG